MRVLSIVALLVLILAPVGLLPAWAGDMQLEGQFTQGGLIQGQVTPGAEVRLGDRRLRVTPDGRFIFGFGRDHPPKATLSVTYPDGGGEDRELAIEQRQYAIQRIDGLPPKQVTPPEEVLARIRRENAVIAELRKADRPEADFLSGFDWPAIGRISGVYGSQRILNGQPRRPHFGIDVAAPEGTPILAPADGLVVLAEDDLYYTGGTVILDHGHGLSSAFLHLKTVTAKVGQFLKKGQPMGTLGATGRATGPHLDWRINWFKERLDPAFLVGPMPGG